MKNLKRIICLLAVCALLTAPVITFTTYAVEPENTPTAAQTEQGGQEPETPETPPEEDEEGIVSNVLAKIRGGWDLYVVPIIASVSSSAIVFTIAGFIINVVSKKRGKKQSELIENIGELLIGENGLTGKIRELGAAIVEISERYNATDAEIKAIRDTEQTLTKSVVAVNTAVAQLGAQNRAQMKMMDLAWSNSDGLNADTKQSMKAIVYAAENTQITPQEARDEDAG